jgi:hypothetical protein
LKWGGKLGNKFYPKERTEEGRKKDRHIKDKIRRNKI